MSNDPSSSAPPITIAARAAHVMLGNRVKGKAIAIGNSAEDGALVTMDLGPDNEILGRTDTAPWSLVLCQWDDSRAVFALDSDGRIYDENTPMEGAWSSWEHANDKIFSTATIPQAGKMKELVYANFKNLQDTVGRKEAMFYLTAVAYDIDVYESSDGQLKTSKVLESMMEDYRLIDEEGLDAIEASTVKAYGRPRFYDLDFSRLAGRWTDWERDLTKLSLPSTMWLILRRATGLLGKVDRSIVIPVIQLFVPGDYDLTQTVMTRIHTTLVQPWLEVFREWVKPDAPGAWADASRLEWVAEYVKLTNLLVYTPDPWGEITPGEDWAIEVKEQYDTIRAMPVEQQLDLLVTTWRSVLHDVFYPSVADSSMEDSDVLDETVVNKLHGDAELESVVLAFVSLLTESTDEDAHTAVWSKGDGKESKDGTASQPPTTSVPQAVDAGKDTEDDAEHTAKDEATITKPKASSTKAKTSHDTKDVNGEEDADGVPDDADDEPGSDKNDGTESTSGKNKTKRLGGHKSTASDDGGEQESGTDDASTPHRRLRPGDGVEDDTIDNIKTFRKSIMPDAVEDDDPDMIDWSEVVVSDDDL